MSCSSRTADATSPGNWAWGGGALPIRIWGGPGASIPDTAGAEESSAGQTYQGLLPKRRWRQTQEVARWLAARPCANVRSPATARRAAAHPHGVVPELRKRAPQPGQQLLAVRRARGQRRRLGLEAGGVAVQQGVEREDALLREAVAVLERLWAQRPEQQAPLHQGRRVLHVLQVPVAEARRHGLLRGARELLPGRGRARRRRALERMGRMQWRVALLQQPCAGWASGVRRVVEVGCMPMRAASLTLIALGRAPGLKLLVCMALLAVWACMLPGAGAPPPPPPMEATASSFPGPPLAGSTALALPPAWRVLSDADAAGPTSASAPAPCSGASPSSSCSLMACALCARSRRAPPPCDMAGCAAAYLATQYCSVLDTSLLVIIVSFDSRL